VQTALLRLQGPSSPEAAVVAGQEARNQPRCLAAGEPDLLEEVEAQGFASDHHEWSAEPPESSALAGWPMERPG